MRYHSRVTLIEALRDAESRLRDAEIDDARLEAEILLCHALSLTREALFARLREPLPTEAHTTFESLLRRRLDHEPTAYIVGHREFYGLSFACAPAALIPRPETELLVEAALSWIDRWEQGRVPRPTTHDPRPRIVDVGTGGGAIAVALAVHCPTARIVAIDPSRQALALARCNASANGVAGRIDFVQGELLTPLPGRFDLIVANLPYVPTRLYDGCRRRSANTSQRRPSTPAGVAPRSSRRYWRRRGSTRAACSWRSTPGTRGSGSVKQLALPSPPQPSRRAAIWRGGSGCS